MKLFITGANGQLGRDVAQQAANAGYEVHALSKTELDITNEAQVMKTIEAIKPDVVIHAAAYTKVDQAETETDLAFLVNGIGTRNVALAARKVGAKFCYVSTDYVFDGEKGSPYHEYDLVKPINVYGESKYAGEELCKLVADRLFIVRTSWVYGLHGHNFVKTMLRLANERSELKVVHDQLGSPTYTVDLAAMLLQIVQTERYGIYHVTNSGQCTWYQFAQTIFDLSGITITVRPVPTAEYPTPARRPRYSVLDHMALRTNGFPEMRHWKDALQAFLDEMENGE